MEHIWHLTTADDASDNFATDVDQSSTDDIFSGFAPLGAHTDTSQRKSVPDSLRTPFFGPIGQSALAKLAVLDAAKTPNLPEILIGSGMEPQCLFAGEF